MTAHDRFDKPFAGSPGLPLARDTVSKTMMARSGPNPIDYLLSLGLLRGDTPAPAAAPAQSAQPGTMSQPDPIAPHPATPLQSDPDAIICGVDLPTATLQAMAARLDRFVASNAHQHQRQSRTNDPVAADRQP